MRPPSPSVLLLLLILLAGLLLSGVLPPPEHEAPPPDAPSVVALQLPHGSSGPSISTQLAVAEDLDRPSPALPPPFLDGATASRSLLSSYAGEHERFLLASLDGTIYSVDRRSRVIQWKLSTGLPLWHSEQALSNVDGNEYFIFPGEEWDLYEYRKDKGVRKINLTVEEIVHNTPEIKGSVVTIGSKTTSLYYVDADSGEVLYIDHLPGTWPAIGIHRVEEKLVSSKLDGDKSSITANNIVTIVRTDYFLNSSNLGKPLWSMSTSTIRASMPSSLGGKLELPSPQQTNLPVIFFREAGNPAGAMLPPASYIQNSRTSEQGFLDMPVLPEKSCETEESYSMGIIAATKQNSTETSFSFESQAETHQAPRMQVDKPISVNTSQNSSKSGNICLLESCDASKPDVVDILPKSISANQLKLLDDNEILFSTSQNSHKGANTAKENFTWILSTAIFGFFAVLLILYAPGYFNLKFRGPLKSDKQSSDLSGRQSVAPKKRKVRKSGNIKNGASISNPDTLSSSEKENIEANSDAHIQSNERYPFNLMRADDASNGRRVGRLFVSISEIGRGSNGTVVLEGVYDGRPVAVKRLLRAHHDVAFKEIQNLIASDQHPNIVRWYGVEQDLDFVYISLERCNCSLSDLIHLCSDSSSRTSNSISDYKVQLECVKGVDKDLGLWKVNGFPSSQLLKLMRDVVSGLAHLHELGIIHRDLKPQNVLISNDRYLNAKLSDMGISKRLLEDMSSLSHHATGYGSSGWQAPEQLLRGRQTRAVDLFSLGCILFFCITKGKHPFGNYFERDSNILNNRVDLFLVDHIPEAVHLLSQLLDADPEMRPTAVEVLHHPLFWRSETRLSFLRDTSDRVELEDRENVSELLKALENISSVAFGGKWGEKLDAALIADMGRYRKYKFDCTRDLLRVIRNKLNHYRELPKELQETLGPAPKGFDCYFSSRFPKLLIEVYKVVSRHCREDESFSKYFNSSPV